jgi:lambda family phage portal protein
MGAWTDRLARAFGVGRPKARRDFAAAQSTRLTGGWNARNISANADLYRSLDSLRGRSRDLCNNNDYAKRFLGMVAANVVGGTGVGLQARIYDGPNRPDEAANNAVESAWAAWCARGVCDVTGRLSLRDIENLVIQAVARDGEALVRKVRGSSAGNPFGFALQVIDIDRLDTKLVRAPERGLNEIKMGVEVNAFGRAVAYWLRPYHPGEMFLVDSAITGSHVRVPADEIQHVYRADRPEALRGIPWMHSAMIRLNHLGAYEEAAVIAARVGAAKMGFFTTPDGQPPGDGEDAEDVPFTEVEPGAFGSLPTGTEFTPFNPDYPHQMFADFVKANLRGISSGMGVAYHALANDLTSVSFSSIRSGTLEERDQWMAIQEWFIECFLEPVYREWLQSALAFGQVKLPNGSALSVTKLDKFSAHVWQPRRWQWVDPRNDMEANLIAVQQGFKTRTQVCAELGVDFEDVLAQLKREQDKAKELGVELGAPKPAPAAPPPAAADTVAATGKAMADAISKMPPPVTNVAPAEVRNEITVQPASAPEVRNEITVQPANAPEVRLEATVEAPTVNVAAPQVTVRSYPASSTEEIERDERGEMVRVHRKNED